MRTSLLITTALVALASVAHAQEFEPKQNDFKTLFNKVRMGQPEITPWPGTYWPYSFYGTGANVQDGQYTESKTRGEAPMAIFDQLAGQNGRENAQKWEVANHNCDNVKDPETKRGCVSWWGHCNGWSAAAIKEVEPTRDITIDGKKITVATAKGIFSEVWLSSNSLFSGNTDKEAKTQDGLRPGGWIDQVGNETYQSFWDLTPRQFFLIATNYMGLAKMGFVIDRFTGDEVWNQPVVGYRILPIRAASIRQETRGSRRVWAVPMKMKLYWGNDLYTPPGAVSTGFDVTKNTNDTERIEENLPKTNGGAVAYEGRVLDFTLFFDSEVTVSADGKQVLSAGKIVGDGIWMHQENPRRYSASELNDSHPDFVWMPTDWVLDTYNDYGNPHLDQATVAKVMAANKRSGGNPADADKGPKRGRVGEAARKVASAFRIVFSRAAFDSLASVDTESVRRKLRRLFSRGGMRVSMPAESVEIANANVTVTPEFPDGVSREDLTSLFSDADVGVTSIRAAAGQ